MNDPEHDQTEVNEASTDGAEQTVEELSAANNTGKLVPVAEAKRYRKRAQVAEKTLAEREEELAAKNTLVTQQQDQIEKLQRCQTINQLLIDAGVLDLETSRLFIEVMLGDMEDPDPATAVADLKRRKPILFRQSTNDSVALSPRVNPDPPRERRLHEAAAEASATGHRHDLLRYLRLRRRQRHAVT